MEPAAEPERRLTLATRLSGGLRARLLLSYIVLLAIAAFASVIAARQVLLVRLDDRVEEDLQQEVGEFRALAAEGRRPRDGAAVRAERQRAVSHLPGAERAGRR